MAIGSIAETLAESVAPMKEHRVSVSSARTRLRVNEAAQAAVAHAQASGGAA
jgi:hypothetical protein